jgi:hypothetical protein
LQGRWLPLGRCFGPFWLSGFGVGTHTYQARFNRWRSKLGPHRPNHPQEEQVEKGEQTELEKIDELL